MSNAKSSHLNRKDEEHEDMVREHYRVREFLVLSIFSSERYMRLWEQKWVIGPNKRNARKGASKFCTIICTEIDNFVFPISILTLRYFSNTFHHDSAPARPRSREVRALLLNVRRRPKARWKGFSNRYAISTKIAIWLGEPDDSFLLSEPHIILQNTYIPY